MSKLSEFNPDWPVEDWRDYYKGTFVVNPETGVPSYVFDVKELLSGRFCALHADGKPTMNVPLEKFSWQHLRHPRLGWVMFRNLPVYGVKKPLREKRKGFRHELVDYIVPGYMLDLINALGLPQVAVRGSREKVLAWIKQLLKLTFNLTSFYEQPPKLSLEAGVDHLNKSDDLAVILGDRNNLLIRNHEAKSMQEFPFLLFHGPMIAGRVRKDMSIEQVGNVDIAEMLYAEQ